MCGNAQNVPESSPFRHMCLRDNLMDRAHCGGLLVSAAGPHVNLAGDDGRGQYSYCVHLRVHGLCPALEVRLGIFLELNLPNLIQCWLEFG